MSKQSIILLSLITLLLTTPVFIRSTSLIYCLPVWALVTIGTTLIYAVVIAVLLSIGWSTLSDVDE